MVNGWNVTAPLADGSYTVTAAQTDANGTTGSTGAIPFTVDTSVPVVTLTAPTAGVTLAAGTPDFTGGCSTPDGAVTVSVTGTATRTLTTQCSGGTFVVAPASALRTGSYHARRPRPTPPATPVRAPPRTSRSTSPLRSRRTTPPRWAAGGEHRGDRDALPDRRGHRRGPHYFTTDGSTPTAASSEGTSIPLTAGGVYTIKYFSVDPLGTRRRSRRPRRRSAST